MSQAFKPAPPKPCPVCQVAMQATVTATDTVHRCQRCGLSVTITATKPLAADAPVSIRTRPA